MWSRIPRTCLKLAQLVAGMILVRFFVLPLVGEGALLQAGQLLALRGAVRFALHQHAVEHVLNDEAAQRGGQPVIGAGHGAGDGT